MSASSSAMMTRIVSLLTVRSLATSGPQHLTARLLGQPVTPARPRTPIGRGSGFKTRAVCVRVAPGAPCTSSSSGRHRGHVPFPWCVEPTPVVVAEASGPGSFHRLAGRLPVPASSSCVASLVGDPPGPAPRGQYCDRVTEPAPHMTPEQFRQHGHEVVDWIADYWSR